MRRNCGVLGSMKRASRRALGLALLAPLLLGGCGAKRPVLYPDATYEQVGRERAERDVDECMQNAEEHVGRDKGGGAVARDTTLGGGAGAAIGAAGGAVRGRAGVGAAVGAATGATAGLLRGIFRSREPAPIFRNYVSICLSDRGYRIVGWR